MNLPNIPNSLVIEIQKSLNEINTQANVFAGLSIAYNGIDTITKFLSPHFPCKIGCSACCYYDVLITTFEAEYIMLKTNRQINREDNYTKNNNSICPFLKDSVCSIYEQRPMICRMYHTLDTPEKCHKDHAGLINIYGVNDYSGVICHLFRW